MNPGRVDHREVLMPTQVQEDEQSNIVYIFQFACDPRHLATSFEIAANSLKEGQQIYFYWWANSTSFIQRNARGLASPGFYIPKMIKFFRNEMMKINGDNFIFRNSKLVKWDKSLKRRYVELFRQLEIVGNIDDLASYSFEGIQIGSAIANALVSHTKERYPELNSRRRLMRILAKDYLRVFESVAAVLNSNSATRKPNVFIFNGRFLHEKAVADCAMSNNANLQFYEVIRDRYLITKEGFHDRRILQERVIAQWESSQLTSLEKIAIAEKYFAELKSKDSPFFAEVDYLQVNLQHKDYFIYYTSSDDEYVGWWGAQKLPLGEQISVVQKLQDLFDKNAKHKLLVKIHPNLQSKGKKEIERWDIIQSSSFSVVTREKISDPLFGALGVLSFGSTAGLEASFWGIPSAVLAPCGYDQIGAAAYLENWDAVGDWIKNSESRTSNLEELRMGALKRGFYTETAGTPYQYAKFERYAAGAYWLLEFSGKSINVRKIELFHNIYFVFKRKTKGLSYK